MKQQLHAGIAAVVLTALAACLPGCGGGGGGGADPNANSKSVAPPVVPEAQLPGGQAAQPDAVVTPPVVTPSVVDRSIQKIASKVGANLAPPKYYSRSEEYVDLLQQSGGFGRANGPWLGAVNIGSDGWPTEDFAVMLMSNQETNPGVAGRYTVVFKGTATVSLIASSGTLSAPRFDSAKGVTVLDLDFPSGGSQLTLAFKNTGGTVKDLRVIRPGYTWNDPNLPVFTTKYLKHLDAFSTLRFMDWTSTNTTRDMPSVYVARWATRPTLVNTRAGTYAGTPGKPWERVIELANAAKTDVWINVPTSADPEYYTELAKLFKEKLAPNLKIYVEYSNEIWNSGTFKQYAWVASTGVAEELALGNQNLKYDNTTDAYTLVYRVVADRTYRISDAFRNVFGDAAMMTRVRPVLPWQVAGTDYIDRMIQYAKRNYPNRPANSYIYAISGAPYFNMGAGQTLTTNTANDVLNLLDTSVQSLPSLYRYEYAAYVAKKHGVKWVAYEAGPDTYGEGSLSAKAAANRHTRMKSLCQRLVTDWATAGGDLLMWFQAGAGAWDTNFGSWALDEFMNPDNPSPKSQCLTWAAAQPAVTAVTRHVIGTPFDAAESAGDYYAVGSADYTNRRLWYQMNQSRDYVVSAPAAACYKLSVSAKFSVDGAQYDVTVNGASAPTLQGVAMTKMVQAGVPISSDLGQVCLDAGVNVLSFKLTTAFGGYFDTILLTAP